jgi:hypothetical protein
VIFDSKSLIFAVSTSERPEARRREGIPPQSGAVLSALYAFWS